MADGRTLGDVGPTFYPRGYDQRRAQLQHLDPQFASIWETYLTGLLGRDVLDLRTRLLVLVGQYTMRENTEALAETIEAALAADLDIREILEVILQCYVYGGEFTVLRGVDVFSEVVEAAGRLDEVADRGLPEGAHHAGRDEEIEKNTWAEADRNDPRMAQLLERYGWERLTDGVRLRPGSLINVLSFFDIIDPDFLRLWLDVVWSGMYGRRVLDDRTRIICIVANCIAAGDTFQYTRHMQGALREGATPKELLEVVLQSCHLFGHPLMIGVVINDLFRLLDELGRLEEALDDPSRVDEVRRVFQARIAMRNTVKDLSSDQIIGEREAR